MWRAFFAAIGIVLIILGFECLAIDSATFVAGAVEDPAPQQALGNMFGAIQPPASDRVFRPTEWFPWSLLATGSIVLLYSVSLRPNSGAG
jgi:LPS sulfotransferase NodH